MKISILLPYKENFSPTYAGAVSLFVKDTVKLSKFKKYITVYRKQGSMKNTDKFIVPENHFFFMGDNRDCSKDSRYLSSVGYVDFNNFVGKAQIIFFSNNKKKGSFIKFWRWNRSIRFNRLFTKIK